ncbi:hypothetical protein NLM33_39425 [Bradyrhizobium sp. CCGUVB1N3]|uniref:hypothetical protein n=1 Tax=Bradyrhizobium sp. CCGUVB1N3 TaxID=2949629 RepID=UPI0020B1EA67|nr:hypothetical protein [Bradyrhizobium sp. CCGUVB1N3]MCP3476292.1 hypothetical protein [Bradyrhizobium sp. CCGUVB1N3]
MTKSILPELLEDLERYLDDRASAWLSQEGEALPTLPSTVDGKVNVRAITAALGRPQSQEQHLFKKPELRAAINAVAIEQKLKPIGERHQSEEVDKAVAARIRRSDMRASEASKLAAEQAAVIEKQRRIIESLREQVRMFEETGQVLRTGVVRP